MRCTLFLLVTTVMSVAWGLPSGFQLSTSGPTPTPVTPVLVKDLGNLKIHVSQHSEGDYGLDVYQKENGTERRVGTTVWSLPGDWRPPGLEYSRLVHAEILSSGDVVVAFFNLENGLDLILLPKELFVIEKNESGIIVYPKLDVPWHPTVSTSTEAWQWPNTTTPYTKPEAQ